MITNCLEILPTITQLVVIVAGQVFLFNYSLIPDPAFYSGALLAVSIPPVLLSFILVKLKEVFDFSAPTTRLGPHGFSPLPTLADGVVTGPMKNISRGLSTSTSQSANICLLYTSDAADE